MDTGVRTIVTFAIFAVGYICHLVIDPVWVGNCLFAISSVVSFVLLVWTDWKGGPFLSGLKKVAVYLLLVGGTWYFVLMGKL